MPPALPVADPMVEIFRKIQYFNLYYQTQYDIFNHILKVVQTIICFKIKF